jgi:YVTN family beta-propeller protein
MKRDEPPDLSLREMGSKLATKELDTQELKERLRDARNSSLIPFRGESSVHPTKNAILAARILAIGVSCSRPQQQSQQAEQPAQPPSTFRIYVTNEASGDLTIIDPGTYNVVATVPLGERPRDMHARPDRKTIYVALSGSPIAGPDVDESTRRSPTRVPTESAYSMLRRTRSFA